MLLHEGKLVLQLLQHLHLGGLEFYSVGPQVIQVLHISQKCCMNATAKKQLLHIMHIIVPVFLTNKLVS